MKKFVLAASLCLSPFASSNASSLSAQIIGGEDSGIDRRPYQVSLQYEEIGGHGCGGALIGSHWVLTAAHCVKDVSLSQFSVVAGVTNLASEEKVVINPARVFIHPNYYVDLDSNSKKVSSDVALIRLASAAPSSLTPLSLATEEDMNNWASAGTEATLSGWGWTSNSGIEGASDTLQELNVPILSQAACKAIYSSVELDSSSMCAGEVSGGSGSCRGDSGGPLTVDVHGKDIGIGIVSFSFQQCDLTAGVYARVATVKAWVDKTLSIPSAGRCSWEQTPFTGSGGSGWYVKSFRPVGECLHSYKSEVYGQTGYSWYKRGTSYYY